MNRSCRSTQIQRAATSGLTGCLSPGVHRRPRIPIRTLRDAGAVITAGFGKTHSPAPPLWTDRVTEKRFG
jgi:hypothetical protein